MPRIKKPKHPPLPNNFTNRYAVPRVTDSSNFKIGDYVQHVNCSWFKGWVCGSYGSHIIAYNPLDLENRQNGIGTWTSPEYNWRKIECPE